MQTPERELPRLWEPKEATAVIMQIWLWLYAEQQRFQPDIHMQEGADLSQDLLQGMYGLRFMSKEDGIQQMEQAIGIL